VARRPGLYRASHAARARGASPTVPFKRYFAFGLFQRLYVVAETWYRPGLKDSYGLATASRRIPRRENLRMPSVRSLSCGAKFSVLREHHGPLSPGSALSAGSPARAPERSAPRPGSRPKLPSAQDSSAQDSQNSQSHHRHRWRSPTGAICSAGAVSDWTRIDLTSPPQIAELTGFSTNIGKTL
jgi:hypothetical protein